MIRPLLQIQDEKYDPIAEPGKTTGFQSPSGDYEQQRLNILHKIISDPTNTFFFEAVSDDMELFNIKKNTLLVVDRSIRAGGGMIVLAWKEGEWLVRQLIKHGQESYLTTGKEKDDYILLDENSLIWGVVTWSCCPQLEFRKKL